jgi:predicted AAA+ superfamily ATPase
MARSGGIFEATRFTSECQVSRPTIANYLRVLENTYAANVIRPFSTHRPTEIISAPKVYGFDTGFVCYYRGWDRLRPDDYGRLWEHVVLNELLAGLQHRGIRYWRDKRGHEVDFVLVPRGGNPIAVECKWSAKDTDTGNLRSFRNAYPEGDNYFVCHDISRPFKRKRGNSVIEFVSVSGLLKKISL